MNRILASVLTVSLLIATSAFADESIRAAQAKLKQGGFYFSEVDGNDSTDFSAAVTRYQIRNGLQITGQLNAETRKALGVLATNSGASAPAAPPNSDTWRNLRKSDEQFLKNTPAEPPVRTVRSPGFKAARATPAPVAPTDPALIPAAQDGDRSTYILSRERVRDYIGAFVLAGLDPQVGAELEFFGDRVRYYDDGVVGREKIARDLQRYAARWPERRFWLAGDIQAEAQPDNRLRVNFPLRFDLRNGAKHSAGKVQKTLLLEVTGSDLQIVAVNEHRAR